jgi:aminoglycoside phosphotransferase (APT) family kinase protein
VQFPFPLGDSASAIVRKDEEFESATAADRDKLCAAIRHLLQVSADTPLVLQPLDGGVSSDILRVETPSTTLCVKRALPQLKVAGDWRAPVSRNRAEVAWLARVGVICPGHVPRILGDDPANGLFAMEWLPPDAYPVWKARLRDGAIDVADARAVGDLLGRIHAATADDPALASEFAHDETFDAIRLEPYLVATGRAHPDLAAALGARVATTAANKRVLVHGDWSPKNILIGPQGPVILDAECAWFGDPAFDVAFVASHLLLKGLWRPQWRARYLDALAALVAAYRVYVDWEPFDALDARVAALLPALLLARVDGKSPVEYLRDDDKARVRAFARPRIEAPPAGIAAIVEAWRTA